MARPSGRGDGPGRYVSRKPWAAPTARRTDACSRRRGARIRPDKAPYHPTERVPVGRLVKPKKPSACKSPQKQCNVGSCELYDPKAPPTRTGDQRPAPAHPLCSQSSPQGAVRRRLRPARGAERRLPDGLAFKQLPFLGRHSEFSFAAASASPTGPPDQATTIHLG